MVCAVRHQRAAAHRDLASLHTGKHMQAEYRFRLEVLEQAFLQHQVGAALFWRRRAFLGRLEDQHHFARQLVAHGHQRVGHAEQGGGVRIMAAGMHHPDLLAAILGRGLGGERKTGLLGDRQRVHVGAQSDLRAWQAALDDGDHAVHGHPGLRAQAHRAQALGNLGSGAFLAVGEFRVGVEIAPPIHYLLLQAIGRGGHLRPLRGILGLRQWGQGAQQSGQQHGLTGHRQLSFQTGDRVNVGPSWAKRPLAGNRHDVGRAEW